jgi:23S rRNA (adenine2503-C2)-methyltransferase
MFMSMGEPMLNWDNVETAIIELNQLYPNADLLVSTVGIKNEEIFQRMIKLSVKIPKIGLQFSIHKSNDEERNELIPFKNKFTLLELRDHGIAWFLATNRPVYLNYCIDGKNNTQKDIQNLKMMFSPIMFYLTFSVICDSGQDTIKAASFRNHDIIKDVMTSFISDGYNVRMFDPAGQDDIGGGCGQLWYVQDWLKEKK